MIVVPTYNMILSPEASLYLPLDMLRRSAGHREITVGEKLILIVAKENVSLADMTEDSFYPIGVSGTVAELNRGFAVVNTQYRVDLQTVGINPDRTVQLTIARRADTEDLDSAVEAQKLLQVSLEGSVG